ncbi:hypothetical protein NUH16_010041 [Penicillium rubens]|nr:hypothetical protein NUH16_003206 [Penicillium rubens]KAJ5046998.1 hypothetical protein NUH16_010041 [Penicillium rubens]
MQDLSTIEGQCPFVFPWSLEILNETTCATPNPEPMPASGKIIQEAGQRVGDSWMVFSQGLDKQDVTMKLLHDSRCLLKQVHLDDWVEQAIGKASASLAVFQAYYEKLSFSLYNFLAHFPFEARKYRAISEIMKSNDCFLHQALAHAVTLHERGGQFEPLQMDAKFIIDPLERLLSAPDRNILLKLTVLKSRYQRYRMSPDMVQGRVFSVETGFVDLLIGHSATAVALQLSRKALARFHHICLDSIRTHDQHLQRLGAEWNELCHDAEEVAAVSDLGGKLEEVAKVR